MVQTTRRERLAERLERQFGYCGDALDKFVQAATQEEYYTEYALRQMQALMKVSTQLAGALARLEPPAKSGETPLAPAENSENRGSIPQ